MSAPQISNILAATKRTKPPERHRYAGLMTTRYPATSHPAQHTQRLRVAPLHHSQVVRLEVGRCCEGHKKSAILKGSGEGVYMGFEEYSGERGVGQQPYRGPPLGWVRGVSGLPGLPWISSSLVSSLFETLGCA